MCRADVAPGPQEHGGEQRPLVPGEEGLHRPRQLPCQAAEGAQGRRGGLNFPGAVPLLPQGEEDAPGEQPGPTVPPGGTEGALQGEHVPRLPDWGAVGEVDLHLLPAVHPVDSGEEAPCLPIAAVTQGGLGELHPEGAALPCPALAGLPKESGVAHCPHPPSQKAQQQGCPVLRPLLPQQQGEKDQQEANTACEQGPVPDVFHLGKHQGKQGCFQEKSSRKTEQPPGLPVFLPQSFHRWGLRPWGPVSRPEGGSAGASPSVRRRARRW